MSIFKDKKFKGQFPGNYSGNLWQTFNIDLEKYPGRIVLSDKMIRLTSGLGVVNKFIRTNATATDQWFGLCSGDILRNGNTYILGGTWITDDTTGTFDDPLDGVIHELANGEQRLIVTRPTDIAILNKTGGANVWDSDWGSTVPSTPIPTTSSLTYRPIARLQRLVAIANKVSGIAKIDTIDKDDVVTLGALTFPADYTIRNIYVSSNRFWIGLQNDLAGNAKIIEWDGTSATYNNEYDLVGSSAPICGFIKDDIPYFVTNKGYIMRYTGGGFKNVQDFGFEFPITLELMSNYGAFVDGDIIYLNIGMPTVQSFSATVLYRGSRRHRSGLWIYNTLNNNLYHNMGIGEHSSAGTDINYGSLYGDTASAGAVIKDLAFNTLVCSASIYTGGATWQASQTNGIYYKIPSENQTNNSGRNRGYFITSYIPIEDIEAMWEALIIKFKRFVNSNNRIVVKWRVTDPLYNASAQDQGGTAFESGGINAPATWASTTTFTCKVPTGVSVGDEVEILSGDNSGCSFAISTLSGTPDNSTSLTVTIAEAAPTSSTDTFLCRFDNWKTETAISSTSVGNAKVPFTSTAHGEFAQFKIELRGFDIQIDDLIPVIKSKTSAKQI